MVGGATGSLSISMARHGVLSTLGKTQNTKTQGSRGEPKHKNTKHRPPQTGAKHKTHTQNSCGARNFSPRAPRAQQSRVGVARTLYSDPRRTHVLPQSPVCLGRCTAVQPYVYRIGAVHRAARQGIQYTVQLYGPHFTLALGVLHTGNMAIHITVFTQFLWQLTHMIHTRHTKFASCAYSAPFHFSWHSHTLDRHKRALGMCAVRQFDSHQNAARGSWLDML